MTWNPMSWARTRLLRPLAVGLFGLPLVQRAGHRLIYLPRVEDWRRKHPCHEAASRLEMYEQVYRQERLDRAVDYLEFGVFQGASMRWWVETNRDPQSRFVGFDTFEGLPEDWALTQMPKGTFSTAGTFPQISDTRCRFVKGLFQETLQVFLRDFARGERLIVHLDADLYSSTLFVLTSLAGLFRRGDLLIFDEFYGGLDEFRAFEDFCSAFPTRFTALAQARRYTQVALRLE